ncbi:Fc.00g004010.m01.CDS01 [Cosmosporella sp. VM-42]
MSTNGSFGTVRKLIHKRTGEALAIKIFQHVFSEAQSRKITGEGRLLQVYNHPNIVELVEAFRLDEDLQSMHIVMLPWAPYTLWEFLVHPDNARKKNCPWFEPSSLTSDNCIYRMMYELSDAIDYLHSLPIKHKDIKPENILLYRPNSEQLTPLITDVGVSKVYMQGGATNYTKSSYPYLSLEQIEKKKSGLEAEIWQLGCCFALLIVAARGGTGAVLKLWESFEKDGSSCQVATCHEDFIKTMKGICLPGTPAQEMACRIVMGMLDLDVTTRLDATAVKAGLQQLY